ncbi:hypothetical protein BST27_16760 [Mycobacterium intermedium]|uniref:Uncharacterized protein n=1 Tax=Mycobacterium intermedium TaxID=28445 RepID=A0A1E3SLJ5_MYCIE|nr:hypothetical protein [Mycobacterium intermedium]MCV6965603.1 hypothetical protein [Mycobacterium intermedium]ODR02438.1 hypothetical protein BHQ20_05020 [Mycobacterium intermedium]OPE51625.1 hypothetical protein BV508_05820 [Mycobacterium intermedium]ORB02268.1 hypothetical protein BST27_16760 [Mycobacterium intermedium]
MNYTATSNERSTQFTAADDNGVRLPGVIFALTWAICLIAGIIALATGHGAVAAVTLCLAVLSPWVGLAWVSRSRSGSGQFEPADLPSGRRELYLAGH